MNEITLTGITKVQRAFLIDMYTRGGVFTKSDVSAAKWNIRTLFALCMKRVILLNPRTMKYYLNPDFSDEIRVKIAEWGVQLRGYAEDFGAWFDAHLGVESSPLPNVAQGGGDEPDYDEQDTPILPMPAIDLQAEFDAAADRLTAARLLYERGELDNIGRAESRARAIAFVNAQEAYEKARIALELSKYQGVIDEMSSSAAAHGQSDESLHEDARHYDPDDLRYTSFSDALNSLLCPNCGRAVCICDGETTSWAGGGGDCPDYDHRHFTPIGLHWRAISDIGVNFAPLWRRLREWYELSTLEALQDLIDAGYVQPVTYGADDDRPEYTLTAAGMAYLAFCDGGSA